ncbi:cellobiose phosphorylase [Clostridium sp. E02]|uniref:alpha-L-rhamnosidase-related protein n=1 Tax=Clostridium sp. E02 TaxID=2487134 RepID=UPI0019D0FC62|nr:cellobiose phosphorylase [Clostridium sp. E02]
MAVVSIDIDMKRVTNEAFLETAKMLEHKPKEKQIKPVTIVSIDESGIAVPRADISEISSIALKKGDSIVLDFGDHQVGYVSLKLKSVGSPQDAPAYLRLKFGEISKEIRENSEEYNGWISRGWIQEEYVHMDVLPAWLHLPRRYAFRYMEIHAVDTSLKFQVVVEDVLCTVVSAVDMTEVEPVPITDPVMQRLDKVSLRTLKNCMQSVFEDGPKRDRRLWLGDLRLQALTNYKTFKNYDLVKRCLYLFAGLTRDDGTIGACLFTEPEYLVDDTFLFDYSLFFISVLKDYYEETKDRKTVEELWPSAYRQIELSRLRFDDKSVVKDGDGFWCFVDWKEGLNKQACAQAIYIYTLNDGIALAEILGQAKIAAKFAKEKEQCIQAALDYFWDQEEQVFVSGENRQVSYASQVWMVLAGVKAGEEARSLLKRIIDEKPEMGMVTPYMNHHFVEALILCGEKEKAIEYMKYYWGGMLEQGADTFWELYNPDDPQESPYGSSAVNSYCHAWSCTPAYLLRKL